MGVVGKSAAIFFLVRVYELEVYGIISYAFIVAPFILFCYLLLSGCFAFLFKGNRRQKKIGIQG